MTVATGLSGPPDGAVLAPVRAFIESTMAKENTPSFAFAAVSHGRVVWQEAFGLADREAKTPATAETPYRVASVSKAITGMAVMIAVERGELALDRPVNDYLATAPLIAHVGEVDEATVRRVANHTAGLTTHYQRFPMRGTPTRPSMDETIRRYGHLVHPPGERFDYSNLGYGILAHVVSSIGVRPFADLLQEEIFAPLGMAHATLADEEPLPADLAAPYGEDGTRVPETCCDHVGASSVACSVADLARLALFVLQTPLPDQQPILAPAGIGELLRPTTTAWGDDGYGIGWHLSRDPAGHLHATAQGGTATASAIVDLLPAASFGVAAVTNTGSMLPSAVAERIAAAMLPPLHEPGVAAVSAGSRAARKPDPTVIGRWTGSIDTYQGNRTLELDVAGDGEVTARLDSQPVAILSEVAFQPNRVSGQFAGDLRTTDTSRHPHVIELVLTRRQDVLSGAATALSPVSGLSHWVELRPA